MERKIVFRGKRLDNGEWIVGDLLHIAGGCLIYFGSDTDTTEPDIERSNPIAIEFFKDEIAVVDPDTIGQFTGLLDKNGKEIYEGDIVQADYVSTMGKHHIGNPISIVWETSEARWAGWDGYTCVGIPDCRKLVVKGNIHDNPSLISDKQ